jgi:hypothetical protein
LTNGSPYQLLQHDGKIELTLPPQHVNVVAAQLDGALAAASSPLRVFETHLGQLFQVGERRKSCFCPSAKNLAAISRRDVLI